MKSIPAGLPINEEARLLAYLKLKFQPGYFPKAKLKAVSLSYGIDKRTLKKLLQSLVDSQLIGQDEKSYYLRSWKFITVKEGFNTQAFRVSLHEIRERKKFESLLFAAKITGIQKAIRRGVRERKQGCSNQIAPSSGFLAKVCKISQGKVSELKGIASAHGLITVERSFSDHGHGTQQTARILRSDYPGIFLKDGKLMRRKADRIFSKVETFRIKNRKRWDLQKRTK
ncbi:MAG: hypothetical protein KF687_06615 [Cyclobacteriaceae bacterium]|nr:hypothetical protein [Cyclobacteriaceae bacterium]